MAITIEATHSDFMRIARIMKEVVEVNNSVTTDPAVLRLVLAHVEELLKDALITEIEWSSYTKEWSIQRKTRSRL